MRTDYDMVVIGGGAAGLTAAGMSALLGAKTLLVEKHRPGGDCTWTGCIPSKSLIRAAGLAHEIRTAGRFGLYEVQQPHDFTRVMERVRSVRQHVYEEADAPPKLAELGIGYLKAHATFVNEHTVELRTPDGVQRVSSRKFIIAAGSRARKLPFDFPVLTNETLFELTEQPRRLVVLGGGPVGIEMAQAFARLGSEVTVVFPGDRILVRDDAELAGMLQDVLRNEAIRLVSGRRAERACRTSGTLDVVLDDGSRIECDQVLAAVGRQPNIEDLGLEAVGVAATERGIQVDSRCRTSQNHIYAAGDIAEGYQFTHWAEHMAKTAVTNALLHWPAKLDERHVTWCTFTDPELAQLGPTEKQLRERGEQFTTFRFPYTRLDRAITEGETCGLVKVLASRSGGIAGVSILGRGAGDMIGEWAVAMKAGLKVKDVAQTIHPYPTYGLGNRRAADQAFVPLLRSRWLDVLGWVFRYRGERRRPESV